MFFAFITNYFLSITIIYVYIYIYIFLHSKGIVSLIFIKKIILL
jgi:hypothetical protein